MSNQLEFSPLSYSCQLLLFVFLFFLRNRSWLLQNIIDLGQHICLSQPSFHSAGQMPMYTHHNHMMTTTSCISHILFSSLYFPLFIFLHVLTSFSFSSGVLTGSPPSSFLLFPEVCLWYQFSYFYLLPAIVPFKRIFRPLMEASLQQCHFPSKPMRNGCFHTSYLYEDTPEWTNRVLWRYDEWHKNTNT